MGRTVKACQEKDFQSYRCARGTVVYLERVQSTMQVLLLLCGSSCQYLLLFYHSMAVKDSQPCFPNVLPCQPLLCCVMPCRAVLCCAMLCCAVLRCAVLCRAVLCRAVLCCAVLCCAVLCRAVLCCAVLCCACVARSQVFRVFACSAELTADQPAPTSGMKRKRNAGKGRGCWKQPWQISSLYLDSEALLTALETGLFSFICLLCMPSNAQTFHSCIMHATCCLCCSNILGSRVVSLLHNSISHQNIAAAFCTHRVASLGGHWL